MPKQFIISRIVVIKDMVKKGIVIIGKLVDNLEKKLYNFSINLLYPKITLECNLKPNSKYVQSKIYCYNEIEINSQIFIENQITHSLNIEDELLLINEETLIKYEFIKNNDNNIKNIYEYYKPKKNKNDEVLFMLLYIILLILINKLKIKEKY